MEEIKKPLSDRQTELLRFIEASVREEQRMPSFREMAKAMKVSAVGTIQDWVRILLERGYLEKSKRKFRLKGARQSPAMSVPIVGDVAAGSLQDAFEVAMGAMPLSPELLKGRSAHPEDYFALRVSGESMIEAGIFPKDYLVIQRNVKVKSGDIVVAAVQGEATVKEVQFPKKSGDRVQLIPRNRTMKTILVKADEDFRVLGKVVAVHRYF